MSGMSEMQIQRQGQRRLEDDENFNSAEKSSTDRGREGERQTETEQLNRGPKTVD